MKRIRKYVIDSDSHPFVGRVFDLSIASLWFDSIDEVRKYPDILFELLVYERLCLLTDCVQSLNHVGNVLWPRRRREEHVPFPLTRYQWLQAVHDIFLMRIVTVTDCCLVLANEVLELGRSPRECRVAQLEAAGAPQGVVHRLRQLVDVQRDLRAERNSRFHEGLRRGLSRDDQMFRTLSLLEQWAPVTPARAEDGAEIRLHDLFAEGRDELRMMFRSECIILHAKLTSFYTALLPHFEERLQLKYESHSKDHPIYGRR